jgi:hypothetical protein
VRERVKGEVEGWARAVVEADLLVQREDAREAIEVSAHELARCPL